MVHSFESAWFAWDFPGFIPHLRNPSVQGKVEKCVTILGNYPRLGKHYDGFWLLVFTSFRFKSNIFPFGTSNNEAQNMSTHSDFPTSGFSFLFFFFFLLLLWEPSLLFTVLCWNSPQGEVSWTFDIQHLVNDVCSLGLEIFTDKQLQRMGLISQALCIQETELLLWSNSHNPK